MQEMIRQTILKSIVCFVMLFASGTLAFAVSVEEIQVIGVAEADETAVIKTLDGMTEIIKIGSSIGPYGKVIEINSVRIVIEEKKPSGMETAIISLVDGKQTLQRIYRTPPRYPMLQAPSSAERKQMEHN